MGKYRLIVEIGHGGMADVFLAVAPGPAGFNKLVVIKRLRASLVESDEFLAMFLDEARLAARLNHPNVIHTYEVGQDEALPYLAMEYLDGQPLHRVLKRLSGGSKLPLEAHLRVLCDALGGLHYAHDLADYDGTPLGVVHRDVSPQNIFVTYEGTIKVVDFGIAKAMNQTAETRSGAIKGKIVYMSPEQARSAAVDRRSDVFALGVMLWEAAVGRRLWGGQSDVAILQYLVGDSPLPSPRSVNPAVPEQLEHICLRALARDPGLRYSTAAEMQAELESFLERRAERATARDVGKLVATHFAREREAIRATIEQQLKSTAPPDSTLSLPKLEHTLSLSRGPLGPFGEETPHSGPFFGSGSRTNGSLAPASAIVASVAPPPPSRVSRGLIMAGLGGFFATAVALGWAIASLRARPVESAQAARPAAEPRPAAVAPLAASAAPAAPANSERPEAPPPRGEPAPPRQAGSHRAREAPAKARDASPEAAASNLDTLLDQAAAEATKPPGGGPAPRWTPPKQQPPKPPLKPKPSVTIDSDNPW